MPRLSLLGIVSLVSAIACGATERDRQPAAEGVGGAAAGAAGGGGSSAGAGQLAGGGGGAGQLAGGGAATVEAAVAECVQYCEGLSYRLPAALCEDWNRPDWKPEFCGLSSGPLDCPEYCHEVYATVTPECAAALPPVVRCVAPTYARGDGVLADLCWLRDCRHLLFPMVSACYGLREQLAAARAAWHARGITGYRLQYSWGSDATAEVVVQAGSEPVVTPPEAEAWTVPKLFDEVERYLDLPGVAPDASYHEELGHVVRLVLMEGCESSNPVISGIEVTPLP